MIDFGDFTRENLKKLNPNWPQIPDHPYRILINGGSGSWKTNSFFNLINDETDIDKIYLYAKDPYKTKYQFLINKRKSTGLKHFNDSKTFMEYLNDVDNSYKNIEEYNPNKKRKILIVTELFIRVRKLNISLAFIIRFYFAVAKNIRLNPTRYFIMKIPSKWELQQIAFNHSSDIDFKDFMNLYKKCTAKSYSF